MENRVTTQNVRIGSDLTLLTKNIPSKIHQVLIPMIITNKFLKNQHYVLIRSPELLKPAIVL